jgi:hypothetical protein
MEKFELLGNTKITSDLSFASALQYNFTTQYKGNSIISQYRIEEKNSLIGVMEMMRSYYKENGYTVTIMGSGTISLICFIERESTLFVSLILILQRSVFSISPLPWI